MKTIKVYIRGICNTMDEMKQGKYIAILEYKGNYKTVRGECNNTTSNRMLIKALMESINVIKEPCKIELYTPSPLGFKSKKSPNIAMLNDIKAICIEKGIELDENVSNLNQDTLIKILRT